MLKLGRRIDGVTIFDIDQMVKVNIVGKRWNDYRIDFDTKLYDQHRGTNARWFVYHLEVVKKENPELCESLANLYERVLNLLMSNRQRYEKRENFGTNHGMLDRNRQIWYPSDDDCYEKTTRLGLAKYGDLGYSLDFVKAGKVFEKTDLLIKRYNGRYPELAALYDDCFAAIIDLASIPHEEYQQEMNNKSKIKIKKKVI